jgi:GT2 family glycosyltransferase
MNVSSKPQLYLSVSVVLHNSPLALLNSAMQSLHRSAQAAFQANCLARVTVYLIDNLSQESYRAELIQEIAGWPQSEFFDIQYLPLASNRGFGAGHNTALELVTSDFHLVLNPDVELQDDTLRMGLTLLLENEDVVLTSPKVFGSDGEHEFLCKRYPSVLVLLLRGFAPRFLRRLFRQRLAAYEMRDLCQDEVQGQVNVAIASGCFMLVRTPDLRVISGFNEGFFLYFEDFDLSLRLGKVGRLVFDPDMRIIHHGGYAANKGRLHLWYFVTSGMMFFNRHGWRWI